MGADMSEEEVLGISYLSLTSAVITSKTVFVQLLTCMISWPDCIFDKLSKSLNIIEHGTKDCRDIFCL